jgi:hypothetical protein
MCSYIYTLIRLCRFNTRMLQGTCLVRSYQAGQSASQVNGAPKLEQHTRYLRRLAYLNHLSASLHQPRLSVCRRWALQAPTSPSSLDREDKRKAQSNTINISLVLLLNIKPLLPAKNNDHTNLF